MLSIIEKVKTAARRTFTPQKRRTTAGNFSNHSDILECKRMLSGTNTAPEIAQVNVMPGAMFVTATDTTPEGSLTLHVDVDNDGTTELSVPIEVDHATWVDIADFIPPNGSAETRLTVTENVYDEFFNPTEVSSSTVVTAEGLDITAPELTSLESQDGVVAGVADMTHILGETHLLFREVGQTDWIVLGTIDDQMFFFDIVIADGEKDFEFTTSATWNGVRVTGEIHTIENLSMHPDNVWYEDYMEWWLTYASNLYN